MPEQLIIVNSDTAISGAVNKSADGSSFEVVFSTPMSVDGRNPTLKCLGASLWYTFPNIRPTNNTLRLIYQKNSTPTTFDIVLANGLYSLTALNNAVERALHNNADLSDDLIRFVADNATQKLDCQVKIPSGGVITNVEVRFGDVESTLSPLLGFTTNVSLLSGEARFTADNIAQFGSVSSVLLHCSAAKGSSLNGSMSEDILCSIPLNASPGYEIIFQPQFAPRVQAQQFKQNLNRMRMYITDQSGNVLDTNGENWSASILLEW